LDWIAWLQSWGDWFYPLAFVWSFFEGETFVIFGGIAAHRGILNLYVLIATVWVGSFCGDQLWFWIGRRWGTKALDRFASAKARSEKVLALLERHDVIFILSFRFLYGIRNIASVALGTSHLRWSAFLFWNFIAAGLWAVSFAGAGYLLGEAAAAIGDYGPKVLLGVVLGIGGCFLAWRSLVWHGNRNKPAAPAPTPPAQAAPAAPEERP
jgi:membrane protein DedA with SNARE-associated domain